MVLLVYSIQRIQNALTFCNMSLDQFFREVLSAQTQKAVNYDIERFRTRNSAGNMDLFPPSKKLHLGCGHRLVAGWVNVDVSNSNYNFDLASGERFPWIQKSFKKVVSQHVIEHLEMSSELIPMLRHLRNICSDDCELWFSCPDIKKICHAYLKDKCQSLYVGRKRRFPRFSLGSIPVQYLINDLFVQRGEHRNLFDFELLEWVFRQSGFSEVTETDEEGFLAKNPEFPRRNDSEVSIYVYVRP